MKVNFKMPQLNTAKLKPALFSKVQPKDKREQKIFALIFALFALLAAYCCCAVVETFADRAALSAKLQLAETVSNRTPSVSAVSADSDSFTKSNMFASVIRSPKGKASSSADSFVLKGTLPKAGAWISNGGETRLVLVRQEFDGWTLEDAEYGRVLLSNNGETCALYMMLTGGGSSPSSGGARKSAAAEKIDFSAVRKADKDKEGYMPRSVLDKLLMNPYDEIGKMKMVPADGGGMKLERISADSVLGLAGVHEGDVIKAVNGVNISNLSDLSNAINSMMSGSRFDVSVQRGGAVMDLKYSVN